MHSFSACFRKLEIRDVSLKVGGTRNYVETAGRRRIAAIYIIVEE